MNQAPQQTFSSLTPSSSPFWSTAQETANGSCWFPLSGKQQQQRLQSPGKASGEGEERITPNKCRPQDWPYSSTKRYRGDLQRFKQEAPTEQFGCGTYPSWSVPCSRSGCWEPARPKHGSMRKWPKTTHRFSQTPESKDILGKKKKKKGKTLGPVTSSLLLSFPVSPQSIRQSHWIWKRNPYYSPSQNQIYNSKQRPGKQEEPSTSGE